MEKVIATLTPSRGFPQAFNVAARQGVHYLLWSLTIWIAVATVQPCHADQQRFAPSAVSRADPIVKIVTRSQVYYPSKTKKGTKYHKPAILVSATVFASIKEWREIKRKKLTTKDAEYHLLLTKANDKFHKALKRVQKSGRYDIMAESGAIHCKNVTATNVTQTMISNLPS